MYIKQFNLVWKAYKREKYAHIGLYRIDTLKDDSEKGLKKCIKSYCEIKGFHCTIYDSKGFYRPDKLGINCFGTKQLIQAGGFIKSSTDKGKGDVFIEIPIDVNGVKLHASVWLDIKIGRDYQKSHQKVFQNQIEATGGVYFMPKNFEQFSIKMESIINNYIEKGIKI